MQRILVVDNYDSFVYNLIQLLRESGRCQFDVVYNDQIDFTQLNKYNKILLSPGPGVPETSNQLLQLIDHCQHTHSILGICLGHQAIAHHFGAKLKRLSFPKHGHEDLVTIEHRTSLTADIVSPMTVGRYHSWVVDPSSLTDNVPLSIDGYDQEGNIMLLSHKELPIFGVQFHPESIITKNGKDLIESWLTF